MIIDPSPCRRPSHPLETSGETPVGVTLCTNRLLQHTNPVTGAALSIVSGVLVAVLVKTWAQSPFVGSAGPLLGTCLSALVSFVIVFTAAQPRSHYIGLILAGVSFGGFAAALPTDPFRQPSVHLYLLETISLWTSLTVPIVAGHVVARVIIWFRLNRRQSPPPPGDHRWPADPDAELSSSEYAAMTSAGACTSSINTPSPAIGNSSLALG